MNQLIGVDDLRNDPSQFGLAHVLLDVTRRQLFADCGVGLGKIALASLLASQGAPAARASAAISSDPLAVRPASTTPRAKSVIFLFMAGAPSQLDLFDHKPQLVKLEGQPIPPSVIGDQRYAFIRPDAAVLAPRFPFARHGQSGATLSSMLPHLSKVVDELTFIKSMTTDQFNHAPAQIFMNCGSPLPGRPGMGSWVLYGLGSESKELPGFVVLSTGKGTSGGAACWTNGFLPGAYAGVPFRSAGDPILFTSNPPGVDRAMQRSSIDLVQALNRRRLETVGDPAIATRINAYETAFKMQARTPELTNLSSESAETLAMYGRNRALLPSRITACLPGDLSNEACDL